MMTRVAPDVAHLHHVGHVVRDGAAAADHYRRLGFHVPPFAFPALVPRPGAPARPVGAGNTHVAFPRNFVELVTLAEDGASLPEASLVPLDAPAEALERLAAGIAATTARLVAALQRFEGLHILVFETPDVDAAVVRLDAAGVPHGPVQRVRRGEVPLGLVEVDDRPGASPEGRLALAEALPPSGPGDGHPNGAVELGGVVLCVAEHERADVEHRYARYLGRTARPGGVLDLGGGRVVLVTPPELDRLLPGEAPPALPAFVAVVVQVRDLDATRAMLHRNGVPVRTTTHGTPFVPASAVLGAAVVFEPRSSPVP